MALSSRCSAVFFFFAIQRRIKCAAIYKYAQLTHVHALTRPKFYLAHTILFFNQRTSVDIDPLTIKSINWFLTPNVMHKAALHSVSLRPRGFITLGQVNPQGLF